MADDLSKRTRDGLLFRSIYVWWAQVPLYGFIFLLLAGTALNPDAPWTGRIAAGAGAAVIAAVGVITRRSGIVVTPNGLIVRRYLGKETRVDWDQVENVRLVSGGRNAYVAVEVTDGRTLRTQGLATGSTRSKWGHRVVQQIEGHRPAGHRPPPGLHRAAQAAAQAADAPQPSPPPMPSERETQQARIKALQVDLARLRSSLDAPSQPKRP
ncbi:PH domain-containing protein [Aquihabitans sp. McL0605]|uniref:PH domain-containing protein n=1 Tax=Aquihabitans sp. McL0605 TaxID=3415671 RepID=UPI003CF7BA72